MTSNVNINIAKRKNKNPVSTSMVRPSASHVKKHEEQHKKQVSNIYSYEPNLPNTQLTINNSGNISNDN